MKAKSLVSVAKTSLLGGQNGGAESYRGVVDCLLPGFISGWACKVNDTTCNVTMELLINGAPVATFEANLYRPDLEEAGIGSGCYGFKFECPQLNHFNLIEVQCRIADSNHFLDLPISAEQPVQARIESLYPWGFCGWALRAGDALPEILQLHIDGDFVCSLPADKFSSSLSTLLGNNILCGFSFTYPPIYADYQNHSVDLRLSSGMRLAGFPITVFLCCPLDIFWKFSSTRESDFIVCELQSHDPLNMISLSLTIDDVNICYFEGKFAHEQKQILKASIPSLKRDGKEHVFALMASLQGAPAVEMSRFVHNTSRLSYCRIDRVSNGTIHGWAYDMGEPNQQALIDIFVDKIYYDTIIACNNRPDLVKVSFLPHTNFGYIVRLGPIVFDKIPSRITLHHHNTATGISNEVQETNYIPDAVQIFEAPGVPNSNIKRVNWLLKAAKSVWRPGISGRGVKIILPVYNAIDAVNACLSSLVKYTDHRDEIIIINDASTDTTVAPLLDQYAETGRIRVVHNKNNVGYTNVINSGIAMSGNCDVILLNSDTIVPPNWVRNLQIAAYSASDIGTVTAISDNAGAFSMPECGIYNRLPEYSNILSVGRIVSHCSPRLNPVVPTGNGFCLYIRRDLIDHIGTFDEKSFPRGYGEENDFCMRARRAGWQNLIDDSTWVHHVRSASFKNEKHALIANAELLIKSRYPELHGAMKSLTLTSARYHVRKALVTADILYPRPRAMFVISTETGGTPQTNQDLMEGLSSDYECFLLSCNRTYIKFYRGADLLESHTLDEPISLDPHVSGEYDRVVGNIIISYSIDIMHIRHIMWHSLNLPSIARELRVPVIFSFHDLYTICPTVNLINGDGNFCMKFGCFSENACIPSSWSGSHVPPLCNQWIHVWRGKIEKMLSYCTAFVTTSVSISSMLQNVYPTILKNRVRIIPHGRDFGHFQNFTLVGRFINQGEKLRVLIPGNMGIPKGINLIRDIQSIDIDGIIEFHFLGSVPDQYKKLGVIHGKYDRASFQKKAAEIRPHIAAILSITAESWCHTLTECWAAGIPVVVSDRGAIQERVSESGGGWIVTDNPGEVYDLLRNIWLRGNLELMNKIKEIIGWQATHSLTGTVQRMVARYDILYGECLYNRSIMPGSVQQSGGRARARLGLIVTGGLDKFPPSTHIRVINRVKHPIFQEWFAVRHVDPMEIILEALDPEIDLLLIQRNALEIGLVDTVIEACSKFRLPICVEIDDYLVDVPKDKDPNGKYAKHSDSLRKLLGSAKVTITSTTQLAEHLAGFCNQVVVSENYLDEMLWFGKQIEVENSGLHNTFSDIPNNVLRLVYLGGGHHSEDAMMVINFLSSWAEENQIRLFIVGEDKPPGVPIYPWLNYVQVPHNYRSYPRFVHWFRSISTNFHAGIAPLTDTRFNTCKSLLKALDYGAVGLPTIATDCDVYRPFVISGDNGLLVANRAADWVEAISWAASNLGLLAEMGKKSRDMVLKSHTLGQNLESFCRQLSNFV